jgi:hypothetical protein
VNGVDRRLVRGCGVGVRVDGWDASELRDRDGAGLYESADVDRSLVGLYESVGLTLRLFLRLAPVGELLSWNKSQ